MKALSIALWALLPPLAATSAAAQVVVLNGKPTIGSDSNAGRLLTVTSANSRGVRVSIRTTPAVALICDERAPMTSCLAWVKAGATISVELLRPESPRIPPGSGKTPGRAQWGGNCVGTSTAACVVTMREDRTVAVDWAK